MTVREFIELLEEMPADWPVVVQGRDPVTDQPAYQDADVIEGSTGGPMGGNAAVVRAQ